jgi:hypothetical protein
MTEIIAKINEHLAFAKDYVEAWKAKLGTDPEKAVKQAESLAQYVAEIKIFNDVIEQLGNEPERKLQQVRDYCKGRVLWYAAYPSMKRLDGEKIFERFEAKAWAQASIILAKGN